MRTQCVFKSVKSFIKQECDLDNVHMFKKFFHTKATSKALKNRFEVVATAYSSPLV